MSMDLQRVINSRIAVRLVSVIARATPPGIAYPVCNVIGGWLSTRRHSKLIHAYRLNQWMARGSNLDKESLDQAVQETLRSAAYDIYDLYHHVHDLESLRHTLIVDPPALELLHRPEFADRGLIILGLHLSNFDLILQSIFRHGVKAMVLTIPNPQGGRQVEYEMRKRTGMNIVPVSVHALRQAIRYLVQGGMLLTGIDRPVDNPKYCPRFFGHPASLPIHYAYLASRARVPVVIMAAIRQTDGHYHVMSSDPLEMEHGPDQATEILQNAEMVLKRAEDFIRLAPQQWNVPLPVWPQLMQNIPG